MNKTKTKRGRAADRRQVAANQGYELSYFARKHGISLAEARKLIARIGNDRQKLNAAAARLKSAATKRAKKFSTEPKNSARAETGVPNRPAIVDHLAEPNRPGAKPTAKEGSKGAAAIGDVERRADEPSDDHTDGIGRGGPVDAAASGPPGTVTGKSPKQPAVVDWRFWTASCFVGFTAGLFAGMSESPVGTALVAGIFGLIGGGGIYGLLTRPPNDEGSSSWKMLQPVALATSLFCAFSIVGAVLGIGLREGWIVPQPEDRTASLIPVADEGKDLLRRQQLKLLILQSELASLGVPNDANNNFVRSFIETGKDYNKEGFSEDESLRDLKLQTQDLASTVEGALRSLSAVDVSKLPPERRKEDMDEIWDDDEAPLRLMSVEEIRYGNVMRAYANLEKARPAAEKVRDYIEESSVPELSAILDLISRYREANVAQPSGGRASPLVNPRKLWGSEPERKLSIKP